jgi:hypothetical protein
MAADMMELVDMPDLGSGDFFVGVQIPLSVKQKNYLLFSKGSGCVAQLAEH